MVILHAEHGRGSDRQSDSPNLRQSNFQTTDFAALPPLNCLMHKYFSGGSVTCCNTYTKTSLIINSQGTSFGNCIERME